MVGRALLAATAFAVLATAPAGAQDLHLRYAAYWGGLHAADFALSMADLAAPVTEAEASDEFRLETRGVMDWIARIRLKAVARAKVAAEPPFLRPIDYEVAYTSRTRDRVIQVDYAGPRALSRFIDRKTGQAVPAEEENKDDFAEADIPPAELENVIDPLLGLTEALRRVRHHLGANGPAAFRLRGFDGRRRFDMDGEFLGTATRVIDETERDTYRLRLTARPVAGFKPRHRVLWNDSAFDLYLSRDGRFVPLQIVSLGHGPVLTLVEECGAPCALPKAE